MEKRLKLQTIFEEILGSENVYYQPPESTLMKYPAIKYGLARPNQDFANNSPYRTKRGYIVTLIDRDPDSEYYNKLSELEYCSFDRNYPADNLNHWVFTLYF